MKFFHLGDLHLGKQVHNVQMYEKDQPFWIEQFLQAVDKYKPDAIVIAGDVYDRRVPSTEAMELFDHMLCELAKRDVYVFIVPGNHDSPQRLSHVKELLRTHKIYIAGSLEKELFHVSVPNGDEKVNFWFMPYVFPRLIADKGILDEEELKTYDSSVRALIKAQDINEDELNVLIAHQNVIASGEKVEHSDSETIIGGLGEINYTAFDRFDYVALGHIHNAQKVGRETVRYSGCPLYYDFSETERWKGLTLVEIKSKNDIKVEMVEIPILHRMKKFAGTLTELLTYGKELSDRDNYYIEASITDKHVPSRAMEQLREAFGAENLMNVVHLKDGQDTESMVLRATGRKELPITEQFAQFYSEIEKKILDGDQEELIRRIVEQQSGLGGDYLTENDKVPSEDVKELVDYLLSTVIREEA